MSKQDKPHLIIPSSGPNLGGARLDVLYAETAEHMNQTQGYYEKALEAEALGHPTEPHWNRAMMEAFGTIMCMSTQIALLTGALINIVTNHDDDDDGTPQADTGGRVA